MTYLPILLYKRILNCNSSLLTFQPASFFLNNNISSIDRISFHFLMHLCFKLISSCTRVRACHLSQRVHLSTGVDKRPRLNNACKLAFKRRLKCNQPLTVPLAETTSWYMCLFYKDFLRRNKSNDSAD